MLASERMVNRDLYMNLRQPRRGVAVRRLRRTICAARKLGTKLRRMDRYSHRPGNDGPPSRGLGRSHPQAKTHQNAFFDGKNHVGDGVKNKRATEIKRQVFKENMNQ